MTPEEWRQGMENEAENVQDQTWAADTRRALQRQAKDPQRLLWLWFSLCLLATLIPFLSVQSVFFKGVSELQQTPLRFTGLIDLLSSPGPWTDVRVLPFAATAAAGVLGLILGALGRASWPAGLAGVLPLGATLAWLLWQTRHLRAETLGINVSIGRTSVAIDLMTWGVPLAALMLAAPTLSAAAGGALGRRLRRLSWRNSDVTGP